jgi:hypothetical protein
MMTKIVQAVNSMVANEKHIDSVVRTNNELFFEYREKYVWSISKSDSVDFVLHFYPNAESAHVLSGYEHYDWEEVAVVTYKTADIGTKEARASFADLYSVIEGRVYGVNEVLDDIINDLPF